MKEVPEMEWVVTCFYPQLRARNDRLVPLGHFAQAESAESCKAVAADALSALQAKAALHSE